MLNQEFDTLLSELLKKTEDVLSAKKIEYASFEDRFHNFKAAALIDKETPERALWGMCKKHLISIIDMLKELDNGYSAHPNVWHEKLGDMRNYLFLLEGLIIERYKNETARIISTNSKNSSVIKESTSPDPSLSQGLF